MADNTHAQVKTPKWALILGASSGFGEGAARALAQAGYDIVGVHLDRKGLIRHDGGVVAQPGLYLMGMQFLRRRKSALIDGARLDFASRGSSATSFKACRPAA